MRHIMHTVEHAALVQAAADFAPHDGACTPYAYSAHPLCVFRTPPMRIPHTPYAYSAHPLCVFRTLTIEENHRREPREDNTLDQLFELTETEPTPKPANPAADALCGKTVDIDLSGYFITYDRTPAKLPGVCAPCDLCRMELHNA